MSAPSARNILRAKDFLRITLVLGLGTGALLAGCAGSPEIRYRPAQGSRDRGIFEVTPIPEVYRRALSDGEVGADRAARLFTVRLEGKDSGGLPPLAGAYSIAGDTLRFEPSFALEPGLRYRATFEPAGAATTLLVTLPEDTGPPSTVVEAVYPSPDVLPENLLKFYVRFSAPMSQGQAWDHLRLLRASGEPVELPFLEIDEELWDPGVRRLTVLIDPGRIKRGVRPLEEVGPALVEGRTYVLEVASGWEDAAGKPLARGYRKTFRVGPPDREAPDPSGWRVSAPRTGTRDALVVGLGEPLDHALLHSAVGVEAPEGRGLEGEVAVEDGERTWRFTPSRTWREGEHHIVVATTLEDLAGNSVGRPFEVDALEPVRRLIEVDVVRVPFRPLPAGSR